MSAVEYLRQVRTEHARRRDLLTEKLLMLVERYRLPWEDPRLQKIREGICDACDQVELADKAIDLLREDLS